MIIKVSEIPEEGLHVEGAESVPEPFADPTWRLEALALDIHKEGQDVLVTGTLAARVPLSCSRCLEPFRFPVTPAVDVRFVPRPAGRGEEHELGADDLETDLYAHDEIDLRALVQGETELGLPMKPLCRTDCQGLCPACGGNRNHAACSCGSTTPDPRWAPLRALLDR